MNWYLEVIKNNYANFSGRARRKEYWMFIVVNTIILAVLYGIMFSSIDSYTGEMSAALIIIGIYSLATIIPNIAVTVRRFHDQDRSGWMVLLSFIPFVGGLILFIFMCLDGTRGENRFGLDPKA